jgi:hypothetical protein
MKQSIKILSDRVNKLIDLANKTLSSKIDNSYVNSELFFEFKTSSLSFILNLYGENHPYYQNFERIKTNLIFLVKDGRGVLNSIKSEIDNGWLTSVKGIVSAEIFSNFLEMSEHLLSEGYKDAAAVMIGSVLEEHLRQLCQANQIDIATLQNGKSIPKKSDTLNSELGGKGIYNKLDQKNVTAWLDLRNKAAHGQYSEYDKQQVELLLQSVNNFMARNSI